MSNGSSQKQRHVRVERGIYKRETADGTRYEFNYSDSCGATRWETVRTLKEARAGRAAKVAAVARGERVVKAKATVAMVAEQWYDAKATRVRPRTRAYYRQALDLVVLPRFGRSQVSAVDVDAVVRLIRDLEREGLHAVDAARPVRPLGRSSIDNYLKPLHGLLALAVRRNLIASHPFDLLTSDDRPPQSEAAEHVWTDDDVAALLAASATLAAKPEAQYDYTPPLRLTAVLGLRRSEVLGLWWLDFDRDEPCLYVRRQWLPSGEYGPTKTRAGARRIALPPSVRDELIALRLRSKWSRDEHPIFASRRGTPLSHRNLSRRGFERARDLAGLPSHLTLHDLRHAAASRLIRGGLDPVTVAAVLGHEDANTTLKVYGHLYDRRRTDDAVRAALAGGRPT
jgi:integrase